MPFPAEPIETVVAHVIESSVRSFARRYDDVLEDAPNVTVQLHANAVEIGPTPAASTSSGSMPPRSTATGSRSRRARS